MTSPAPQPADGERENECAVNDQRICTTHDQYYKLCWPHYMPGWKPMTTPASADGERCECGRPLRASQYQEVESGLCLWCLNGGPPNAPTTPASAEPTECLDCGKTTDQPGYTVRCVACRQRVDHHAAELVKTNHGSGRGWRCARCNEAVDDWFLEVNAGQETDR